MDYYSANKKEQNCFICRDMDEARDCHTDLSQKEKDKHHTISLTQGF